MAQWTFIDPNTLLPGDPWTSAKAQAAFENLEAVIKSAPGAPRPATFDEYFSQGGGNLLSGLSDGGLTLPSAAFDGGFSGVGTTGTSFISAGVLTITGRATGTIRFNASQTGNSEIEILKNGGLVQAWTAGLFPATRQVAVAAASSDTFEWRVRRSGGTSSDTAAISSMTMSANDTAQRYGVIAKVSEVE